MAPSFYKAQNEAASGFMGAILTSSDEGSAGDHRSDGSERRPLKQKEGKKKGSKVRSVSSGYNISSEEDADLKKPK